MLKLFDTLIAPYLYLDLELNSVDLLNFGVSSIKTSRLGNAHPREENNILPIIEATQDESGIPNFRDNKFQQNHLINNLDSFFLNIEPKPKLLQSRAANFGNTFRDFFQSFRARYLSDVDETIITEDWVNPYLELFVNTKNREATIPEAPVSEPTIPEPETIVFTDKDDYAPGETATIFGSNFDIGETIQLQVLHIDGTPNTGDGHLPWFVTDGGAGDLDGVADGNFRTEWFVNPDDSLNSTFELTAVGQTSEVIANHTFTDSDPAVQFFYIPEEEEDIKQALIGITNDFTGVTAIETVISITVSTDNSIIYYDHWEDGYETDINNPTQSSSEVWGDNDPSNGIPPGFTIDILNAGDIIALENSVTVPRDSNAIFYDARDKLGASKAIVVSRAAYPDDGDGTLIAGAVEVYDTSKWGTEYEIPIGENLLSTSFLNPISNNFGDTSLFITASENGTTLTIDGVDTDGDNDHDGNDNVLTAILNEGETYFVDGGVLSGATVTASKPVQAQLLTGELSSGYASRSYTLLPTAEWSNSYYTPVGTVESGGSETDVFLYNPDDTGFITVNYETATTSGNIRLDGGEVERFTLPFDVDSGARFYTDNTTDEFWAVTAFDSEETAHDWGFSLVPENNLTPVIQIGWGPGNGNLDENGNPVWVMATAATTIYVDYDGDGVAPFTDINGGQYDESFSIGALETIQITDTKNNDFDQSGIRIYTVDGTSLAGAWGQDPTAAAAGTSLDLGTTVLPLPVSSAWKTSTIIGDDGDGLGDVGEIIEYTINIQNDGVVLLGNVNVSDIVPDGTTYVAGSTSVTYIDGQISSGTTTSTSSIADDSTGTAFPLDDDNTDNGFDAGLNIGNIDTEESAIVTFRVTINDPYDGPASGFITNAANVDSDDETFTVAVETELDSSLVGGTQTKTLYLSDDSGNNDLDRIDPSSTGSTDSNTSLIPDPTIRVRDEFSTQAYNRNDGTDDWSGDWDDQSNNSSATGGRIRVNSDTLRLRNLNSGDYIQRSVDLTGMATATLSFGWRTISLESGEEVRVSISNSSTGTFTSLFTATGNINNLSNPESIDISSFISNDTTIRFDSNNADWDNTDNNDTVRFDDIEILASSNSVITFNQSISMQSDFDMPSGQNVIVTAYIDVSSGTIDTGTASNNDIAASLTYDSGTLLNLSTPSSVTDQGSNIYQLTWQTTLNSNVRIPTGEAVSLDITNNDPSTLDFQVRYDGTGTFASAIDFPTTSVIDVDSIKFYNDSSANGGNQINAISDDSTVYVRVQVSDPFGDYDITGLNLVIDEPDTTEIVNVNLTDSDLVDTSVDTSGNGIKIYEYAWSIANGADLGNYTITATATEGLESSPITAQDNTTFTVNNSTAPDVFIGDDIVTEGTSLVFDVTLTDTSNTDIILDLTTTEGTATAVGDYEIKNFEYSTDGGNTWISGGGNNSTQVTIPAGQTGIKVRIDSVSDTTDEPDETFILGVGSVVSGSVNNFSDTGTGTILDDDATPNLSITDVSLTEGDSSTKNFTFTVTLDQSSNQTVTVDYATADGTSGTATDNATTADNDYESNSGTLTFAPGETSKTINVTVNGDTPVESDEIFTVDLSNATNANIIDAQGLGTIINDDSIPDVVIGDDSEVEGNQLVFDVGLTSASSEAITLTLNTTDITATEGTIGNFGVDYEDTDFEYSIDNGQTWINATSDQVIIPAGETSIKVRIDSTTDGESEDNETFTLGVASVVSGTVGDSSDTGIGTIIDDDGTPTISINDVSLFEGDSGTTSFTFTVSLNEASSSEVTVNYQVDDGTATTANSDYTDDSGTVTFAAGETSKTITVDVVTDLDVEPDETFTVVLSNPSNATISDSSGLGTILNDDDNTGSISGTVLADIDNDDDGDQPLSGVTIELLDSNGDSIDSDSGTSGIQPTTTTTAVNGTYSFTNVDPGTYLIKQTNLSGYADVSDGDSFDDGIDDTETNNGSTNDNLITVVLANQESDTGNDFIDEETGTISGEVLADTNNDDVGDSPLSGVTVELFEDGGVTAIDTTTTDINGNYSFTNVAPGDYEVRETNPADYGDVTDSDGNANSNGFNTIDLTLASGGTSTGNDFVDERGVISGTVEADTDNNDIGDTALENVTITLKTNLGATIVATTTTDASGNYSFTDLPSGTYTVEQTNLAGYNDVNEQDSNDDGNDDTDLENSSTNNDNILDVVLVAGETDTGNDFVDEAQPETIAGKVLEDTNGDGVGDTPLAGVLITLSGAASDSTTTASDGSYSFDVSGTGEGTYTLTSPVSNTGTVAGYDHLNELDSIDDGTNDTDLETNNNDNNRSLTVALVASEIDMGNDFVYEAQTGTISGTVFANEGSGNNGKDGVVLNLLDGNGNPVLDNIGNPITTTTSGGGTYSFTNLEPGNYQIQEVDPSGYSSVSDGDSNTDTVEDDTTNSNTKDNIIAVTLLAGETDSGNDFYDQLNGTISGTVTEDTTGNNTGDTDLGGVTVTLKDSEGNTVATDTTDSNGDYSFSDVIPGDYTVEQTDFTSYTSVNDGDSTTDTPADDAPNSSTTDNTLAITLLAGETDNGNDFVDAQNGTISGTVLADLDGDGDGDTGLSGVTITLDDGDGGTTDPTTITASDGTYSFTDVAPGTYTIVETDPTGYVSVGDEDSVNDGGNDGETGSDGSDDNNITVALIPGESDTGNDFIDEQTGTISGNVKADTNNDNIGDLNLAGVTITLRDSGDTTDIATTTTDASGNYSFTDFPPGSYLVKETNLGIYSSDVSDEDSVDDGANDSDTNSNTTDDILAVDLVAGESDTGNDFVDENNTSGTISGQVLEDTDGDGVGDTPLSGVRIDLTGDATDNTTTAADGTYSFTGLANGSYTLTETDPTSPSIYVSISDTDGDNDNTIAVTLSGTSTGNDFVDGLPASLSGLVWEDIDGNGLRGPFEDVVEGVNVTLIDGGADGVIGTGGDDISTNIVSTNPDGTYTFSNLIPERQYQVTFGTPGSGYTGYTTLDQGSDDTIDSDADPNDSNKTSTITLDAGENKQNVDGGLLPTDVITVKGTDNSESLSGTPGNDVIAGCKGQDTLTGGDGSDTFFFSETSDGIDVITDFTSGTDKLDFSKIVEEIEAYNGGSDIPNNILLVDGISGYITWQTFTGVGTMVRADFDASGSLNPKDVVFLQNPNDNIVAGDFIL